MFLFCCVKCSTIGLNVDCNLTFSISAIPHQDSCSSLSPPDPENAPPLYSICQEHALAPPTLQFINSNSSDPESPVTPEILFVLPSYDDIVNEKVPSGEDYLPPAYFEKIPEEETEQIEQIEQLHQSDVSDNNITVPSENDQ